MKHVSDMTMEEFKQALREAREKVMDVNSNSKVGTKQDRRYGANMQRGNFWGQQQSLARQGLRELNQIHGARRTYGKYE